ncbi:hypothetical protein AB0M22_44175 [Nocardia sp. NPDC051756]|uniref:hypothetical protein n=1 Tax=Nocardia sp. NPDC051756 TaxID=3154751 RepID=UPI00342A5C0B
MLYNPAAVNALITELAGYHKDISTERHNAETAANNLLKEGWQSGDGGASAAFQQKHKTLIDDLDDLLVLLAKGKDNVQAALDKAMATDQKVADDFTW